MNITQWLGYQANETTADSITATSAGLVFTVFPGDDAQGKAGGKSRSELYGDRLAYERPYAFNASFTVPDSWIFTEDSAATLWQIHSTPDKFDVASRSACLTCYLVGDKFKWRLRSDEDLVSIVKPDAVLVNETPCERGRRYNWRIEFSPLSYTDKGLLKIFLDGDLVGSHSGANCYHDLRPPYPKFGCYVPQFPNVPYRAIIYHEMTLDEQ